MAKRKGRKRPPRRPGYMKPYMAGYINTGSSPNINVLKEYAARVRADDEHTMKLFEPDTGKLHILKPSTAPPHFRTIDGVKRKINYPNRPKQEIILDDLLHRKVREFLDEIGDPNIYRHIVLTPGFYMFHNQKNTRVYIVQIDHRKQVVRRSRVYGSTDVAKRAFKGGWVNWVGEIPIPEDRGS